MKFTLADKHSAQSMGYVLDLDSPRIVDKKAADVVVCTHNRSVLDSMIDALCDNAGSPYRGDDEELYAVEFDWTQPEAVPVIWQRLRKT